MSHEFGMCFTSLDKLYLLEMKYRENLGRGKPTPDDCDVSFEHGKHPKRTFGATEFEDPESQGSVGSRLMGSTKF